MTKTDTKKSSSRLNLELVKKLESESPDKEVLKNISTSSDYNIYSSLNNIFKDYYLAYDENFKQTIFKLLKQNVVRKSSEEELRVLAARAFLQSGNLLSAKKIKTSIETWLPHSKTLPEYPSAITNSLDKIGFNYIELDSFNKEESLPTPAWDSFLLGCGSNKEAFKAYVWLILNDIQDNHQYLVLRGSGRNGKSSVTRFLERLLGKDATTALSADSNYWLASLEGKRLGIFSELNNTSFPMRGDFKAVSGQDTVVIAQKFLPDRSVRLTAKLILCTNRPLMLGGDTAEKRRVIQINLTPVEQTLENFEEMLWEERFDFLAQCKKAFGEIYNKKTRMIDCSYEDYELESAQFEETEQYIFDKFFILDKNYSLASSDFHAVLTEQAKLIDRIKISNFTEFIKRNYNIKKLRTMKDSTRTYFYLGLKPRVEPNTAAKTSASAAASDQSVKGHQDKIDALKKSLPKKEGI